MRERIRMHADHEVAGGKARAGFEDRLERAPLAQDACSRPHAREAALNGEPRPPFGPTRVDDRATGLRFHAHAKAVRSLAARFRWLVSSFHFFDGPSASRRTGYYIA
jgi:hypothetical protein